MMKTGMLKLVSCLAGILLLIGGIGISSPYWLEKVVSFSNNNTEPAVVSLEEPFKVLVDEIDTLNEKWAGDNIWFQPKPVEQGNLKPLKWKPVSVRTNYHIWEKTLTSEPDTPTPVWLELQLQNKPWLYGKTLTFYTEFDVRYPQSEKNNTYKVVTRQIKKQSSFYVPAKAELLSFKSMKNKAVIFGSIAVIISILLFVPVILTLKKEGLL